MMYLYNFPRIEYKLTINMKFKHIQLYQEDCVLFNNIYQ